jgi:hypothetical protein
MLVIRAELPQDGFGASRRDRMERKGAGLGFIAQRRFQERKEGIGKRIRFGGYDARKSEPASWEGRRWPDTRATMSATKTKKEGARALVGSAAGSARDVKQGEGRVGRARDEKQTRARAAGLAGLGPRRGNGERRARGSKWAAGEGLGCRAESKEEK